MGKMLTHILIPIRFYLFSNLIETKPALECAMSSIVFTAKAKKIHFIFRLQGDRHGSKSTEECIIIRSTQTFLSKVATYSSIHCLVSMQ